MELELLRVHTSATEVSPPAPHFKVVAQPNEWAKTAKRAATSGTPSTLGLRYQDFLDAALRAFKAARPGITNASRVGPQNWLTFSAGRSGFGFGWTFSSGGRLACELYVDVGDQAANKGYFDLLLAQRAAIEAKLGMPLVWERLDNRRASRLAVRRDVPDSSPFEHNDELKTWAVETMVRLVDTLRPMIKTL